MDGSAVIPMPPGVSWGVAVLSEGVWSILVFGLASRWAAEHDAVEVRRESTGYDAVRVVEVSAVAVDD